MSQLFMPAARPLALLASLALAAGLGTTLTGPAAASENGRRVLPRGAVENPTNDSVSLPLLRGHVGSVAGPWVEYVVLDSSRREDARARGTNFAPRLANAGAGAQDVTLVDGQVVFAAGVDFTPVHRVVPGPTAFPPAVAEPGSVGAAGYSPLVRLPDGTVLNAPQVANASGDHDKLLSRSGSGAASRAVFDESEGFYEGHTVYYVSFDASDPGIAALERSTYTPMLNSAPTPGSDGPTSARSGIAPFLNGQTGVDNPNRQGLSSALSGDGDPLNVLQSLPSRSSSKAEYTPLWDVHATMWTAAAIAAGLNTVQSDFEDVQRLSADGLVTGPGGAAWGAIGVIVDCPVISIA